MPETQVSFSCFKHGAPCRRPGCNCGTPEVCLKPRGHDGRCRSVCPRRKLADLNPNDPEDWDSVFPLGGFARDHQYGQN